MNMLPRETNTLLREKPVSSAINQSTCTLVTTNWIEINRFVESAVSAVSTINSNVRALTYFERAYIAELPRLISKMAQLSVSIITFSAFLEM